MRGNRSTCRCLIAIAASFGVGKALEQSGVAKLFAGLLVDGTRSLGPTATLAAIYFGTMVLNELISNNAAAALSFPFCLESARLLGVSERPFVMAVTLAASYAFASPIGYQTHMMVFGPGGYRFTDFMRVGIPLNLLMWIVAIILIPTDLAVCDRKSLTGRHWSSRNLDTDALGG